MTHDLCLESHNFKLENYVIMLFKPNICLAQAVSVMVHFPSQHAFCIKDSQLAYCWILALKFDCYTKKVTAGNYKPFKQGSHITEIFLTRKIMKFYRTQRVLLEHISKAGNPPFILLADPATVMKMETAMSCHALHVNQVYLSPQIYLIFKLMGGI